MNASSIKNKLISACYMVCASNLEEFANELED
jgi:hypothetical protein